jgi:hypothetical protein
LVQATGALNKGLCITKEQKTCQIGPLDLFPYITNSWPIISQKVNIEVWEIRVIEWENKCQYD